MSLKDFFIAVIKILALLIIVNGILPVIPNMFFLIDSDISSFFILLGVILFNVALIYLMLLKADVIINALKLTKGFESDTFNFSNVESKYVVKMACALIGLYLISYNFPSLIYELFLYFQKNISSEQFIGNPYLEINNYQLQISLISVFVGLLIIAVRKQVSEFFTSKTN